MKPQYYTLDETADILRISKRYLQDIKADGKIGHYKMPGAKGKILFSIEHITNFLKTYCS